MKQCFETRQWVVLILLTALLLQSCAAFNIQPLGVSDTIKGLQSAVNGLPGTVAYMKEGSKLVFLGWPASADYAWMILDKEGNIQDILKTVCGQKACAEVASDLINWLEANGYKSMPVSALPAGLTATVKTFAYLLSIGATLPILPVLFIPLVDPMDVIQPKTEV